ncbi:DUF7373 family lipoprotein [Nocardia camponoti]|uniref:Uncharacterized protein n=1 Tax=Nocardia camponoti TaxID=1616106 RepID=A0A917QLE3_9NOCA|nr:hypothetical protein [Nocardia camponoti]GGK57132.1 hypothetical protein GCM10011591_31590 [Nocardia camponoti]
MKKTLFVAIAMCAVSGCASTVSGVAGPGSSPVDLATLQTGSVPTEPSAFTLNFNRGSADETIRLVEARELLNLLVQPTDIDADLTSLARTRAFATVLSMTGTNDNSTSLPAKYSPALESNNMVAGVTTARTNGSARNTKKTMLGVIEFATDADATKAAEELFRVTMEVQEGSPPRHPIVIADHPDAHASSADDVTANSFQAHGPYVIVTSFMNDKPGADDLGAFIKKVIDRQIPALDQHKRVPLDDILDTPVDPDGIMRRATGKSPGDPLGISYSEEDFGTFTPSGILHFTRDAVAIRKAMADAGVDLIGRRYSTVYRTRDSASAFALQTALAKRGKDDLELTPPPGISDAQCLRFDASDPNRGYDSVCVVVYGRYVAEVISQSSISKRTVAVDQVLQERTAAQYAILKKSE